MERREFLKGAISASAAFTSHQDRQTKPELSQAVYAIVEIMGYKKLAGRLQMSPIPGLLQLDVPVEKGFVTQMINTASIYRITLCDAATVTEAAKRCDPLPTLELEAVPYQRSLPYRDDAYDDGYDDLEM